MADAELARGDADNSSSNIGGCIAGSSSDCGVDEDDDDALYGLLINGTCFDLEKPAENWGDTDSDSWPGSVLSCSSCSPPFGRRFLYFLFTLLTSAPVAAATAATDVAAVEERGVSVSDCWCRCAGCSAGHFS